MKGFPNYFATAFDVNVGLSMDKPRTQEILKKWISAHEGWYIEKPLQSPDDGITDDTHRVITEEPDEDGGEKEYYQEVYGPLPGNKIHRLGLTIGEAKELAGVQ